jgi:hypothetical protein
LSLKSGHAYVGTYIHTNKQTNKQTKIRFTLSNVDYL